MSGSGPSGRFCGRTFSPEELEWIQALVAAGTFNRAQLARRVCEQFNWLNPAGQLKAMSCRVAMLRMERAGLIRLPKPLHRDSNGRAGASARQIRQPEGLRSPEAQGWEQWRLELVHTPEGRRWYQALMEQYHYLGYKPLAGAQLRYLIWKGGWLAGGLGFGAAAWSVAQRDQWIGWTAAQRQKRLPWVVNNNRFLILPWMGGSNGASRILGRVSGQLPADWENRYGYKPVLLETFVEAERFYGGCYRAANWTCIGQTQGRGKLEKNHRRVVPIKRIFVYPLTPNFRDLLCR